MDSENYQIVKENLKSKNNKMKAILILIIVISAIFLIVYFSLLPHYLSVLDETSQYCDTNSAGNTICPLYVWEERSDANPIWWLILGLIGGFISLCMGIYMSTYNKKIG